MSEILNETAGRQVIADLERSIAEAQGAVEALRRFYGLPLVVPPPPPRGPSSVCQAIERPAKSRSRLVHYVEGPPKRVKVPAQPDKASPAPAHPAPAKPAPAVKAAAVAGVDQALVKTILAKFDRVQPETRRSVEAILAIGKPFTVAQFMAATGVELKAAYSTLHRFVERKIIERVGMGLYQVVKPEPALAALSPEQLLAQHRPQPAADLDPRLERDEPNED